MQILLLGDSLIEWGDWQRLLPDHQTINRGRAGETAEELSARLHGELSQVDRCDAILVMSGTNNLLQGDLIFPALFETMLPRIHLDCPNSQLIVNGIMPMPVVPQQDRDRVNRALAAVADQTPNSHFLDMVVPFATHCLPITHPGFLGDGVHLSTRGYQVWADTIAGFIATLDTGSG